MACNEGIKLIASKKQTIVQGIKSATPYTNYLFEITLDDTVNLTIDSVIVYDSNRCMKVNHYLSKKTTANKVALHAAIKEGNYTLLDNCNASAEKVMVHYKINTKSRKIKISSFEEETVTRR
ncbi:hypothetical protein U8527_12400 [Kordia algicida OT-1]|uniref:Uncharacterized protein n=1 Tax=Kordia algicida OT-1 TaxID=391587 RepID=A9EBD3_9FLAO|nr:hypothetical protein [Kordia algicida]EDP94457.1 hypothetical protein KAOT1_05957 [Kordia algicida OT-1]